VSGVQTPYGPEPSQTIEWTGFSQARRPLLLVALHGGFWRAAYGCDHLRPFCTAFAARGFAVASLEYRRLGEAGGGWPGTLDDVRAACAALALGPRRSSPNLTGALLVGHSAGGQLALWAAARVPAPAGLPWVGVVGLAPVTDLLEASHLGLSRRVAHEYLGGSPQEVPTRYRDVSPAALLPLGLPTTLVHGTADEDVPYAMSQSYVQRARAGGDAVSLVTLEGGGHFDVIEPTSAFWPQVTGAIESFG
jgi:acetyl esterase/lipase